MSTKWLGMKASIDLISQINHLEENTAKRLSPNLIVWKEGSSYDMEVTNRQFDALEKLLENQGEEELFYIVDLSLAKRPHPEMLHLVEKRLEPLVHNFKHVAVYTGNNYIMYLGIKFYFIRFKFISYSAHSSYESALKAFNK